MKAPLRFLLFFASFILWILSSGRVHAGSADSLPLQNETPTAEPSPPTPAEVIEAVNNLRILNGLNALAVHPVLMDVAAQQANALAASGGTVGHQRPCGLTLGQDLLSRGFALWGDLSQDGYRSENWGTASSTEEIVAAWLMDELHANTMFSPDRSHIGAAAVESDEIYIVLETALQTDSGQMQYSAYDILTGIPVTQAVCIGLSTQNAPYGNISQYSVPVSMSTARPDGDVIHEVQYGQTLWGIAIQYSTTIEQIKRFNNLTSDIVVPGWTLLIQKGATQPATLTMTPAAFETVRQAFRTPTLQQIATAPDPVTIPAMDTGRFVKQNSAVVFALVISFSVLVAAIVGFGKRKQRGKP